MEKTGVIKNKDGSYTVVIPCKDGTTCFCGNFTDYKYACHIYDKEMKKEYNTKSNESLEQLPFENDIIEKKNKEIKDKVTEGIHKCFDGSYEIVVIKDDEELYIEGNFPDYKNAKKAYMKEMKKKYNASENVDKIMNKLKDTLDKKTINTIKENTFKYIDLD